MARKPSKKGPVLTPARDGRGSTKRNRCLQCDVTLKGRRPDAKYCGHRCRQAAYRAAHAKPETVDTPATCDHCGGRYWSTSGARKYCSPSCRTLASRTRRTATVDALAGWLGISDDKAADAIETQGLKPVASRLEAVGFMYDQAARCWRMPATLPVLVRA